jgi:hypothetical protein
MGALLRPRRTTELPSMALVLGLPHASQKTIRVFLEIEIELLGEAVFFPLG